MLTPTGFVPQPIKPFPTPGQLIELIPEDPKRQMLIRMYPEYQDLCTYAHGRPFAGFGKGVFDDRSPARGDFIKVHGEKYVTDLFQQEVLGPAQIFSLISIAQATAELTQLYPSHLELQAASTRAWNELHGTNFMVNAVWHIRTKGLLGALG